TSSDTERTAKVRTTDSQLTKVTDPVTNLQAQNDLFRAENDKVKQHYKQLYDSIKITRAKHIEQVTKLTAENVTLKTSVSKAKESVETICDIVKEAKVVRPLDRSIVSACRYTQHSQELLEYAIVTCPQGSQQRAKQIAHTPLIRKKQVTATKPSDRQDKVKRCPKASGSQSKSNHKTNRISPAKGANKLPVEDLPRINKSHPRTTNRVDSSSRLTRTVINSDSDSICQTCNKCLTSFDHDMCLAVYVKSVVLPHSTRHNCEVEWKIQQVWKPKHVARKMIQVWKPKLVGKVWKPTDKVLTTIAENTNLEVLNTLHMDLCGPMHVQTINGKKYILVIMDDYSRFTWVKFLRSKDKTPNVLIKFITQIQVGLNKTVRYICIDNGTEFINHTMTEYYERIGIFHQKTVPKTPQQNGVVERRNHTLVEAARTMLIFSKAPMFLWAEAVATACYTQNCSLIHTRGHKTPYELVHNKKPNLTFFRVFGALCYHTNDNEDLGKLQPTADTGIFISLGLVPNPVPATPYASHTNKELEILFQPMFDEYLDPPRTDRPGSPAQAVQSSSHLSCLPPGVVSEPHFMEDHNVTPVDNYPFVNIFASKPHSEASSSGDISSTELPYVS
nr:ribonuclease H-like domain-containing protein [Tanacetum cinerariifolium]